MTHAIDQRIEQRVEEVRAEIEAALQKILEELGEPPTLYEPIVYTMVAGGKRMRPLMTILSAAVYGNNHEAALYAGIAIEILHNFTLVHDDIMDKSLLRRGNPTVHKKWDESTAILSGDAMIGLSYRILAKHIPPSMLAQVISYFTEGFIEVCEGQAMDIAYSHEQSISLEQYLIMIEKKTSRLPEIAAVIGAFIGGAPPESLALVRRFAREAGIAFQIQDDLLDLMADQAELGKTVGQDLIEGKKTYLILRALERVQTNDDRELMQRFVRDRGVLQQDVNAVRELMVRTGVIEETGHTIEALFRSSLQALQELPANPARDELEFLINSLRGRKK